MPSEKDPHYLRSYRMQLVLSQDDVAQLTGCKSGAKFSKYECFRSEPNLRTALACEIIFGVPLRVLFAGTFEAAQLSTSKQALRLLKRLVAKNEPRAAAKVEALRVIIRSCEGARNTGSHA